MLALELAVALAGCATSAATKRKRQATLAEQLSGTGRSVSEDVRGLVVTLPDILFDFDQASLRPDVESTLIQLSEVFLKYPAVQIHIEGHTDSVGGDEYNQGLSERRAQAVRDFFIGHGISPERTTAAGFGESRPIADNESEEGRQKNRRVELVLPDVTSETTP